MKVLRRSEDRGHVHHGWLNAKHSFSFGSYYDDRHLGFRDLRVINEDQVAPGAGFPSHGHQDMEIITYIIEGALEHKDSMGSGSVIRPGDVQYMSAASGVMHSEFNHSKQEKVHLLQIWILPKVRGGKPAYAEKHFPLESRLNQLCPIATADGKSGSLHIRQDANVYASILEAEKTVSLDLANGRHLWVQVAKGELLVNGERLKAGDGLAISQENKIIFNGLDRAEFIIFDLS